MKRKEYWYMVYKQKTNHHSLSDWKGLLSMKIGDKVPYFKMYPYFTFLCKKFEPSLFKKILKTQENPFLWSREGRGDSNYEHSGVISLQIKKINCFISFILFICLKMLSSN